MSRVVTPRRRAPGTRGTRRGWRDQLRKDPESQGVLSKVADMFDPPQHPLMGKPVQWIHSKLGEETWSKQDEILESLVSHRKTGVWACHSSGKSHISSRAIAYWMDVHPLDDVFIVTSAPSAPQVRAILWRYLKDAHRKGKLPGYITDSDVPEWKIDGRLVGWGRKPANLTSAEEAKAVFQGIHAKYVLVVLDEADGIPKWLWDAVQTLLTSPTNRLLAIGNPDNPASHFATIRKQVDNTDWNKITIAAADVPAFTGEEISLNLEEHLLSQEWVEEAKRDWGEDNPLYVSKVLAQYPATSDDALITPEMLSKAILAYEELPGDEPGRYAMDVARYGKDKTVIYRNRGGVITKVKEWAKKDTTQTADLAAAILFPHKNAVPMVIDIGGVGSGPFDQLRRAGYAVKGFDGAERALSETQARADGLHFLNRRAEQYWTLREEMERGAIGLDPRNLTAQAELLQIDWTRNGAGRIVVEKKEEIKKKLGHSPDDADAIMMSTVPTDQWELVAQERAVTSGPGKREDAPPLGNTHDLLARAM